MNLDDDIKGRTATRKAMMEEVLETQERMAHLDDFVWDRYQQAFWDLKCGSLVQPKALDAYIPKERWRMVEVAAEEEPAEGATRGPGRPKKAKKPVLIKPSDDIMRKENGYTVESSTWWPGKPQIIRDTFVDANGPRPKAGFKAYNSYLPPDLEQFDGGDASLAGPWVEHVKKLWPDPFVHEHFFDYVAHMIQQPHVKCNHALVLSGTQGIGKDMTLEPIKAAIGIWNVKGINPDDVFSAYNPWVQSVMLIIDEIRSTDTEHRASDLYNKLKTVIAAPPDILPMNEKYKNVTYVVNVCRVVMTTNEPNAMYIPDEDRRLFMMHSDLPQFWNRAEGDEEYFERLAAWYQAGGTAHVVQWLLARDLSAFKPRAPAPRTEMWDEIVSSWAVEEDVVAAALERVGEPAVLFAKELQDTEFDGARELADRMRGHKRFRDRMGRSGYKTIMAKAHKDDMADFVSSERFTFKAENGGRYQSKSVFVKTDAWAAATPEERARMIHQRGTRLAHATAEGHGESKQKAF